MHLKKIVYRSYNLANTELTYVFINQMTNNNSDIIFLFLIFFFKYKPFTQLAFNYYKTEYNKDRNSIITYSQANTQQNEMYQLKSPTETLFNYFNKAIDMVFIYHSTSINNNIDEDDDSTLMDELSAFKDDLRTGKQNYSQRPMINSPNGISRLDRHSLDILFLIQSSQSKDYQSVSQLTHLNCSLQKHSFKYLVL